MWATIPEAHSEGSPSGGGEISLGALPHAPHAKAEDSGALFAQNLFLADASSGQTNVRLFWTLLMARGCANWPPPWGKSRCDQSQLTSRISVSGAGC
jgi:hypothetical protein